jgi:hypothetical protein
MRNARKRTLRTQVGSQLQKASESAEADDLVLAWIESIHANDRLLSFVAAFSSLPARHEASLSRAAATAGDCIDCSTAAGLVLAEKARTLTTRPSRAATVPFW